MEVGIEGRPALAQQMAENSERVNRWTENSERDSFETDRRRP